MNHRNKKIALLFAFVTSIQAFAGNELFSGEITIDGVTREVGYNNIESLIENVTIKGLQEQFPNYTNRSALDTVFNFRGLDNIQISSAANSNIITLSIPSLGINKVFNSSSTDSRKANFNELRDFLQGQTDKTVIDAIQKALVANSPIDPVIGNSGSLASSISDAGFEAISASSSGDSGGGSADSGSSSSSGVLPRFGTYTSGDEKSSVISLPYSRNTWNDKTNRGYKFGGSVTIASTDSALAGNANVHFGVGLAPTKNWRLTPIAFLGAAGSKDLGSAAYIVGAGLGSSYAHSFGNAQKVVLNNLVQQLNTEPLPLKDFVLGPKLSNQMYRNGIEYIQSFPPGGNLLGMPMSFKASYTRTDYTGDKIFSRFVNEYSMSLGLKAAKKFLMDDYRIGVTVTNGDKHNGISFNGGYKF